ncbi:MAG: RsmB/NOP family class I SAM-dependent RNA methyltransferase [Candidatus Heimdallarchaeota archaeon]|nr:RsmB/NOP family class I SAM-dependent RNA methyltransferase [Candidatus Heimdallarchaeota archaeon]MCK4290664.1 RsmB/NOP family class I SAM-dependent RNA methyltransferase [Candidatus Heimdallarchaeota archaeon]
MVSEKGKSLAEKFGYLPETIERFLQLFGLEETKDILQAYERKPKTAIRINELKINPHELIERMEKKGFVLSQSNWYENGFFVEKAPFPLGATTEYLAGYYFIQSAASWIPSLILNPEPGELVIDLTAAPGGKSSHLAQLMKNEGTLFCIDLSRERIKSLRSNLARCGVKNNICIRMNAIEFPKYNLKADKVLLDAPCTGEGLMATDISRRTSKGQEDINRLAHLQKQLVQAGIKTLKKEGVMVYSTCSTAPEENEEVINWTLDNFPVRLLEIPFKDFSPGFTEAFDKTYDSELVKAKRLYPHKDGTEGFFVCKLVLLEEVE